MKKFICIVLPIVFALGVFACEVVNASETEGNIPVIKSDSTYKVIVEHDLVYAEGLSHKSINSADAETMPLKMDIYVPDNDIKNRPVFMFIHGGGFSGGSKQQGQIIRWANHYTSRGWVFISVDYRLKKHKGTVPIEWVENTENLPEQRVAQFLAIYPAIRDAKAALRWVIANAGTYNIDTNYITIGGASAGAMSAIAIGISEHEDYRDEIDINIDKTISSTNLEQSYKIRTIVNLWGSKTALDILERIYKHQRFDENDPSLFIAHGTKDPKVPFSKAEELKTIYEANGVPLVYYPLEGKGHGVWGAKVNDKPLEELAFESIVELQSLKVE
ncbi:MAG: alpha/beta hydrolase [Melioribacteraceae bacterium]|nr:alpha/beta hydrolase [Melioribacteraceae bacterium]